jgi:hypothetical protein
LNVLPFSSVAINTVMPQMSFDTSDSQSIEPIPEIDWSVFEVPFEDDWKEMEETKYKKSIIDWSRFDTASHMKNA